MANPPNQGDLHFSARGSNHATCYEVRHQTTSVWCVPASVKMLLDFYRYEYTQNRLASALGLGTASNPKDLPVGMEGKVVTAIEALTSNALDVAMHNDPTWADFRDEIVANHPVISFVPGHARTIAGYAVIMPTASGLSPSRHLVVYDPSPPEMGGGIYSEDENVQTYTFAFTARLDLE
jgi:hypothetical protein